MRVDWGSVGVGGATTLMFVIPSVLIARALSGDEPSPVDAIVPLAMGFGFGAGGFVAARRAAHLPYSHSAASAAVAWVALGLAVVSRSGFDLARALTLVLFILVTTVLAMGGGVLAFRRRRDEAQP